MIFPQFVIYVLIYNYLKFRKEPSITSQEIANYISVALAVALSVVIVTYLYLCLLESGQCDDVNFVNSTRTILMKNTKFNCNEKQKFK